MTTIASIAAVWNPVEGQLDMIPQYADMPGNPMPKGCWIKSAHHHGDTGALFNYDCGAWDTGPPTDKEYFTVDFAPEGGLETDINSDDFSPYATPITGVGDTPTAGAPISSTPIAGIWNTPTAGGISTPTADFWDTPIASGTTTVATPEQTSVTVVPLVASGAAMLMAVVALAAGSIIKRKAV